MAEVFISYKRERRPAAHYLARILERNGFSAWYDYSLFPGKPFTPQLLAEIEVRRVLITRRELGRQLGDVPPDPQRGG